MGKTELTYELIYAAVNGDKAALEKILEYYDSYMNTLATVEITDSEGNSRRYVDQDMKAEMQLKYLEAIPKCKVLNE